ncbi:hypothetical protein PAXRUDRAFT_625725 [Paxillus rubicundulus Ve08.2h10]|uniref:Uncharacterized protein n=1 Tax=Paxillus rubicundulus Ve08.2h10 TaxID=930991 RepID=A0A0D0E3E5_9AGAM|nr:hypothetical protein PAXRUDRAFT_625725 [Paxillus rubicundulus Ve08.2h10]
MTVLYSEPRNPETRNTAAETRKPTTQSRKPGNSETWSCYLEPLGTVQTHGSCPESVWNPSGLLYHCPTKSGYHSQSSRVSLSLSYIT